MSKILIIEDEASFSEAITFLLKKEGFDVAVANNGQDGINLFDKNGADLILLDLMLPGLSGTEVCRQIRLKSNVPIIMLTARDTEIDKVVGLELGADDYVTKPYSSRELIARINALLRRSTLNSQEEEFLDVISIGPIKLDIERHILTLNNMPVQLPLKEFELLEFLMRNSGRVLTRSHAPAFLRHCDTCRVARNRTDRYTACELLTNSMRR